MLTCFGAALFFTLTRQVAAVLDRDLTAAVREVERAVEIRELESSLVGAHGVVDALDELRIPGRQLFVFDGRGRLIHPESAPPSVAEAARQALAAGSAWHREEVAGDRTWRLYAERFEAGGGPVAAVALADAIEIEQQFPALLAAVLLAGLAALVIVAIGGAALARKALIPVEQSLERMQRFVADASHELRTPAAVLRTRAEVTLQRARSVEEYAAAMRETVREAERLGGIVDSLLLLASADVGQLVARLRAVYLDDLLVEAVGEARTLAAPRGVHIEITAFEEAPILAEPPLVRQLLLIVLENAVKYSPDGGHIGVAVTATAEFCRVRITDAGPGIPRELIPRVFERFYRADPARARTGGVGLGLSIARAIARAHGASIHLSSRVGHGTTVAIDVPRAPATR